MKRRRNLMKGPLCQCFKDEKDCFATSRPPRLSGSRWQAGRNDSFSVDKLLKKYVGHGKLFIGPNANSPTAGHRLLLVAVMEKGFGEYPDFFQFD